MIDLHSHILPGIDDGSKDVVESLALLGLLKEQKIDTVVATPHFDANLETVDRFLERRSAAMTRLASDMTDDLPRVLCGSEVGYYPGIDRMQDLSKLCIEGGDLLLLEMPMSSWNEHVVRTLEVLSDRGDITVVLAHMERYMGFQSKATLKRVYQSGVLIQCNADFFLDMPTRHKAMSMLKVGEIDFIGSDCHNIKFRAPRIGAAYDAIERKLGKTFKEEFDRNVRSFVFQK